jgi:hypothetical protein
MQGHWITEHVLVLLHGIGRELVAMELFAKELWIYLMLSLSFQVWIVHILGLWVASGLDNLLIRLPVEHAAPVPSPQSTLDEPEGITSHDNLVSYAKAL